jgi:hypothetical protein
MTLRWLFETQGQQKSTIVVGMLSLDFEEMLRLTTTLTESSKNNPSKITATLSSSLYRLHSEFILKELK